MHDSIVSFAETDFHPALVAEVALYCGRGGFLDLGHEATGAMTHRERMAARIDKLNVALASGEKVPDYGRHPARLGRGALYDHKRVIYRAATALHLAGAADIDNLRSIRNVITPGAAAVLVDALQARSLRPTYALRSLQVFSQLSKRCGLLFSPAESMAFRELRSDLYANGGRGRELSDKNLKRLWQFDDPDTFAMLVALPQVMMQELEERRRRRKGRATLKDARQARAAVGMEILSTLPIRRGTLLSLDLRRNFLPRRDAPPLLVIYPDQVKTARALEATLSRRTWRLITLYRRHYRPLLLGTDKSDVLFPGRSRQSIAPQRFGEHIAALVRRRVGASINLNLWRHLMASKLAERRERMDDAGRLLGHVPGSSSTKSYVRIGTRIASMWLRELTDEARTKGIGLLRRSRRAYHATSAEAARLMGLKQL